jgi:hypothetical protein
LDIQRFFFTVLLSRIRYRAFVLCPITKGAFSQKRIIRQSFPPDDTQSLSTMVPQTLTKLIPGFREKSSAKLEEYLANIIPLVHTIFADLFAVLFTHLRTNQKKQANETVCLAIKIPVGRNQTELKPGDIDYYLPSVTRINLGIKPLIALAEFNRIWI